MAILLHHDREGSRKGSHSPFRALSPRSLFSMTKEAASQWSDDKASRLAAALSYYTIFSIAPLLIIAISVAGLVFGKEAASNQIFGEIRGLVGDAGARAIQTMVQSASGTGSGILGTLIGIATLLVGASGAFAQLQDALDTVWNVRPKPGQGVRSFIRTRFLSFSMVLVIGFLLLVSMVVSAFLAGAGGLLERHLDIPSWSLKGLNFLISFSVTTLLFTLIYKVLPDARIRWRDVWIGGVVTALLFSIGRFLIGLYLGKSSVGSAYGAAGSLVIILLWIYYSSQILFFGAEFTQVYANRFGSRLQPTSNAERLTEQARADQGLKPDSKRRPSPADGA